MKITREARALIRETAARIERGRIRLEIAYRSNEAGDAFNLLRLVDEEAAASPCSIGDTDLFELYPFSTVTTIEDAPGEGQRARIDIYIYGREELLTNMVVDFDADGAVAQINEGPRTFYQRAPANIAHTAEEN